MSDEPVPMLAQYAIRLVEAQRQRDEAIRLLRELVEATAEPYEWQLHTLEAAKAARQFLDSLEGDSK